MKRILIGGVAGGIVLFVWGLVSWMTLPWHQMEMLPGQEAIAQSMRDAEVPSGVYAMPWVDEEAMEQMSEEEKTAAMAAFTEAHERGPLAFIVYSSEGGSVMPIMSMIVGLILDIILAGVAALMLAMAAPALPGFPGRVFFVLMLGVYTAFATHMMNWNWMSYPLGFSLEMAGDTVVAALLLGIVLAIIIRPLGDLDAAAASEVPAGP